MKLYYYEAYLQGIIKMYLIHLIFIMQMKIGEDNLTFFQNHCSYRAIPRPFQYSQRIRLDPLGEKQFSGVANTLSFQRIFAQHSHTFLSAFFQHIFLVQRFIFLETLPSFTKFFINSLVNFKTLKSIQKC